MIAHIQFENGNEDIVPIDGAEWDAEAHTVVLKMVIDGKMARAGILKDAMSVAIYSEAGAPIQVYRNVKAMQP